MLRAKAATVADKPTFIWVDNLSVISSLSTMMNDANLLGTINGRPQLVQIVIYNLPGRDCSAPGSSGDFSLNSGGLALYKNFIDQIATAISQYPNVRVVAIIEPKSLYNIVSNMHIPKCQAAANIYHAGVVYALQTLNPLSVYMYVDASHAGILGWPSNLSPAAQLFAQLYNDAGQPAFFRGLATNVANYNKLRALSPDSITSPNPNFDELHYIEALAPLLSAQGFSAHFIVDQSRAAVQGIRADWVEWCNIDHAGFGDRPTLNTGSTLIDAIVWAKLGGVSDGTSDPAAASYDPSCGRPTSKKPSPETNQWFQAYFEMLVQNAVPPL
ncbi:hypothetical protein ONZ45_g474 [Pleurotus djamor]|nr:hypothetical protein ONZ45_g474 [Pleurotus djamor]